MSVEPTPITSTEVLAEAFSDEMAQIQEIWQALPDAHQVALVLQLADSIMTGVYRPYLQLTMTQQWPLQPEEFPTAFPRFEITQEALLRANVDEEDAAQLTAKHRNEISETMRSHYIHDLFWPELRHIAGIVLGNLSGSQDTP